MKLEDRKNLTKTTYTLLAMVMTACAANQQAKNTKNKVEEPLWLLDLKAYRLMEPIAENEKPVFETHYATEEERCLRTIYTGEQQGQLQSILASEYCLQPDEKTEKQGSYFALRFEDTNNDAAIDKVCTYDGEMYPGLMMYSLDDCITSTGMEIFFFDNDQQKQIATRTMPVILNSLREFPHKSLKEVRIKTPFPPQ